MRYVSELATVEQLLLDFRRKRSQIAAVVDEFGGTAGIITLEDVLEEIVGDLADAHSAPERPLVDRVSEEEEPAPASTNYERLAPLAWLVGRWVHEGDGLSVEVTIDWTKNENFLSRTYTVTDDGETASSGLQVIGWDPQQERIVSWLFDSDGGVVTGVWSVRDDRWVVQSTAKLADGGIGSYTSVLRPIGEDGFGWQKVNQVLDGELLPNVDEILFQRR